MTKIKLCGLSRISDIDTANRLFPEYVGFVFAKNSSRYVSPESAAKLKRNLDSCIFAVGVFVREKPEFIAELLTRGIIDMVQLHGGETQEYVENLKKLCNKPIIQAFSIKTQDDVEAAMISSADYILLDSGNGGTGNKFDWSLLSRVNRPFFLAGGINKGNVKTAIAEAKPYAVDVSSGIETNGRKDKIKMRDFVRAVRRKEDVI